MAYVYDDGQYVLASGDRLECSEVGNPWADDRAMLGWSEQWMGGVAWIGEYAMPRPSFRHRILRELEHGLTVTVSVPGYGPWQVNEV